jgi:hypothetical protein
VGFDEEEAEVGISSVKRVTDICRGVGSTGAPCGQEEGGEPRVVVCREEERNGFVGAGEEWRVEEVERGCEGV